MKIAFLLVSLGLFLGAAKVHGRALRLEREAAGFHHVVFGGQNPPEVEALWRAERLRFWGMTIPLALAFALAVLALRGGRFYAVVAALAWAPSLAFLVGTLLSHARR